MPFPLSSQGSCKVVAPDGLLKASLSGPASLMNTAAPAAFPLVTGVWLYKAEPGFVYLLLVCCVCPTLPSVSRCQHATGEEDLRFDHDMILSSCRGAIFFFFAHLRAKNKTIQALWKRTIKGWVFFPFLCERIIIILRKQQALSKQLDLVGGLPLSL